MLIVTFEIFIFHCIMEYVSNLCSSCPSHEQSVIKENSSFLTAQDYHVSALYGFSIRRKHFAGNFSSCINKISMTKVSKLVL